jgi:hypothetical protein
MIVGVAGAAFFAAAAVERVKERIMLENGDPSVLFTIPGEVESAREVVGLSREFVVKLKTDTMEFVGGDGYPNLYEFGTASTAHLKPGDQITLQVETEKYLESRIEAQRGGSKQIQIASLSSTREKLLKIETYLDWRKRDSMAGLLLMPSLTLFCLWLILVGWQQRTEDESRNFQPIFGSRANA